MISTGNPCAVSSELIRLEGAPADKRAAIAEVGAMLIRAGRAGAGFDRSMQEREAVADTYLGQGVAIPHGMLKDKGLIREDGIAVLRVPAGVEWNPGQIVRFVIGIAAGSESHIAILKRLTRLVQEPSRLASLLATDDPEEIVAALQEDRPGPLAAASIATDLDHARTWRVAYPAGLHVRPATELVDAVKAGVQPIRFRHGADIADGRSLLSILQLGLRQGDDLVISASGPGAAGAVARIVAVADGMVAAETADAARAAAPGATPERGWMPSGSTRMLAGVAAGPGLAIGAAHIVRPFDPSVPDTPEPLVDAGERLDAAIARTRDQLAMIRDETTRRLGAGEAAIFKGQAALLDDADLIAATCRLIVDGHGAAWAWHHAIAQFATRLEALGNPVLGARAADLRDVGWRVTRELEPALSGTTPLDLPPGPVVILAADMSPSDTAGLDLERVAALATAQGGPTSHSAILARTLGLPAIVACGPTLLDIPAGTTVIVDGDGGRIHVDPSEADLASARAWIAERARARMEEERQRSAPAITTDGVRLAIAANVNKAEQVAFAVSQGGEGVGLMRTEFLFLEGGESPTEDQQVTAYRAMIDALGGRPLIVRALDIGGDKQVAHLALPQEENPFLGVRGARLLLRRRDLLEPQLRALYRAAIGGGDVSLMFPMITSVAELVRLREICETIRAELGAPAVPIGIMIEVPAAAVLANRFAEHADFFSIGTNDLTQYTLAMDRQNTALAAETDAFHPAVLRLIALTVQGAATRGRWVGVCGGLAGDPLGAALLAGLGVTELSMAPRDIPAVKARLRRSDLAALRSLAERALACSTPDEVRALAAGLNS